MFATSWRISAGDDVGVKAEQRPRPARGRGRDEIWGVSAALSKATEIDGRLAKYTNDDLAEYRIPVNADIDAHEVIILPEADTQVNALGSRGVGELGMSA